MNKNLPEGEKQAGRQAGRGLLHSQTSHREHTPGAVGSHLYCILMLVIMVVLGKPNIF